jgi:hypothetical protein
VSTLIRGGSLCRLLRDFNLDLHPDGQRFAVAPAVDESAVRQDKVVFIFNFFDELRRCVAAYLTPLATPY